MLVYAKKELLSQNTLGFLHFFLLTYFRDTNYGPIGPKQVTKSHDCSLVYNPRD